MRETVVISLKNPSDFSDDVDDEADLVEAAVASENGGLHHLGESHDAEDNAAAEDDHTLSCRKYAEAAARSHHLHKMLLETGMVVEMISRFFCPGLI